MSPPCCEINHYGVTVMQVPSSTSHGEKKDPHILQQGKVLVTLAFCFDAVVVAGWLAASESVAEQAEAVSAACAQAQIGEALGLPVSLGRVRIAACAVGLGLALQPRPCQLEGCQLGARQAMQQIRPCQIAE